MKQIGKNTEKVVLAAINAFSDGKIANCSSMELVEKLGIAKNNLPHIFASLCSQGYLRDITIDGYYKRFEIITQYSCPDFIFSELLSNTQKNFLLKCLENNITEDMSKKELARRIYNNENNNNISRALNGIYSSYGKTVFEILEKVNYISGLIPSNAESTEFGYRTIISKPTSGTKASKTAEYLIQNHGPGLKKLRI